MLGLLPQAQRLNDIMAALNQRFGKGAIWQETI